jgi:hypothetical protein
MRCTLIIALVGVAVFVWMTMHWKSEAEAAVIKERFEADDKPSAPGVTGEQKNRQIVADVMDMYKDMYGKYPATEVLVHYRDVSGTLTREELKARIKSDGGSPPGIEVPSEKAEAQIAVMEPPKPAATDRPAFDKPILPATEPPADSGALAARLMNIASQISALAEEMLAGRRSQPKAFETFVSFRG